MKFLSGIKTLTFYLLLSSCATEEKERSLSELASEVVPVKVISVKSQISNTPVQATGLLSTENEASYGFKIGGVIRRILVAEGQSFRKGQLLASLRVAEIEAQFSQAQMAYHKAKRDHARANNLYKDSVATLEQLQNAKTGLDISKTALDAVAFNKRYAHIYAHEAGFVSRKMANEGEVISPGSPVLVINELKSDDHWMVRLGLTDKQWTSVSIGQKAIIQIDAFPDRSFQGVVVRKSRASDHNNGLFQGEIQIVALSAKLAAGMFARVSINTGQQSGFALIPYEALIEADGNTAMVFVPLKDKVKRIPIVIESFNNDGVLVKSGLEKYPQIITSNSAFLNESSTIKIIP